MNQFGSDNGMKVLAVIGDIVGSRQLRARAQFQRRLQAALRAANERRGPPASPYTLTLGDEFQAVYRDAAAVWADVFALMAWIAPVQARFALGTGELATPLNPAQAIGMDGPAFHRARAELEALKASGRLLGVRSGETAGGLAGAALRVVSVQVEGWKPRRLRVFADLLAGKPVAETARQEDISPRAVYKNIRAAGLDEIRGLCDELARVLNAELKTP